MTYFKTGVYYHINHHTVNTVMRITFIPLSEDEFKLLSTSSPLHKGGGLDDINIFQPKQTFLMQRSRRGGGILSFLAKRVLPFIFKAAKPSAKTFV